MAVIKLILKIIISITYSTAVIASDLKPFTSDGCSSFPDGTFQQKSLWRHCCFQHDFSYWKGGTENEKATADKELQLCVAKVGEPAVAKIMLAGVKIGGSPHYNTSYRWAYGWSYGRGYKELSHQEKKLVKLQLENYKSQIDYFINQLSINADEDKTNVE